MDGPRVHLRYLWLVGIEGMWSTFEATTLQLPVTEEVLALAMAVVCVDDCDRMLGSLGTD